MDQKKAAAIAAEILKNYPGTDELFITTDGQAFFTENDAINHSHSLKKAEQEVFPVKRNGSAEAAPVIETEETITDGEPAPAKAKRKIKI